MEINFLKIERTIGVCKHNSEALIVITYQQIYNLNSNFHNLYRISKNINLKYDIKSMYRLQGMVM